MEIQVRIIPSFIQGKKAVLQGILPWESCALYPKIVNNSSMGGAIILGAPEEFPAMIRSNNCCDSHPLIFTDEKGSVIGRGKSRDFLFDETVIHSYVLNSSEPVLIVSSEGFLDGDISFKASLKKGVRALEISYSGKDDLSTTLFLDWKFEEGERGEYRADKNGTLVRIKNRGLTTEIYMVAKVFMTKRVIEESQRGIAMLIYNNTMATVQNPARINTPDDDTLVKVLEDVCDLRTLDRLTTNRRIESFQRFNLSIDWNDFLAFSAQVMLIKERESINNMLLQLSGILMKSVSASLSE